MNYGSLTNNMQTYMLRSDAPYVQVIPQLIEQGINRIYANAKDIGFEKYSSNFNLTPGNFRIPKPAGWRETISLAIVDNDNNTTFLQERTMEFCKTYLPNPALINTPPKYYYDAVIGDTLNQNAYSYWHITPNADVNYNVNIVYLGIPVFNNGNTTNILTNKYPSLLLYSCLLEASIFLDNEEKRNKYEGLFGKELETILNINQSRMTDRTVSRDKS